MIKVVEMDENDTECDHDVGGGDLVGGEPVHQLPLPIVPHTLHEKHHLLFLFFLKGFWYFLTFLLKVAKASTAPILQAVLGFPPQQKNLLFVLVLFLFMRLLPLMVVVTPTQC